MGSCPNLSSTLLLIPLLFNWSRFCETERWSFVSLAFVSSVYHTSRESDIRTFKITQKRNDFAERDDFAEPSLPTYVLYKIDHLQIQLGLTHMLLSKFGILGNWVIFKRTVWAIVACNDIFDIDNSANKLTAILMGILVCSKIFCLFCNAELFGLVGLFVGIFGSFWGYRGSFLIRNSTNHRRINRLTEWSETNKCMWHGGMAIVVTFIS